MDPSMMFLAPGKTAPRLILDLLNYDPRRREKSGRNVLADAEPRFKKGFLSPTALPNDCQHSLARKDARTRAPSAHELPHNEAEQTDKGNPLHHFRLIQSPATEKDKVSNKYEPRKEIYTFLCSGQKCPALLDIEISGPRLPKSLLGLINDKKILGARGRRELDKDPIRYEGQQPSTPANAYWYLRSYLSDAKGATDPAQLKKIAKRNKKYKVTFDDECDELFEHLGFLSVKELSQNPDEGMNGFWQLPIITDDNRYFIDDVIFELDTILGQLPQADQMAVAMNFIARPVPAMKDIERSLGCADYPTKSREIDLSTEEHPWFRNLGAVDNFTDELIIWAYDRQCECDPRNKPYYLDCLEGIAQGRQSSDLELKFTMAVSVGEFGLAKLEDAYKYFGLTPGTKEGDDHVMGLYKSRIASAPKQKNDAMAALLIIAKHRNSDKIEALATDNTMTYEEALELLGVTDDSPSDSIEAASVVLALDMDKARVAEALRAIAQRRGNDFGLRKAASAMGSGLGIDEAYNRLQIGPASRNAPDETIFTYYQSLSGGAPSGSKDSYSQALETIALDRGSSFLLAKLSDPNAEVPTSAAEPVGLGNIGNTCYLNSLLQYLYTIKPIRDMVADFQDYRMDITPESLKVKRVGGRLVDKDEIVRAQCFVDELRSLFESLKTAPGRFVTPNKELAELTLVSQEKKEEFLLQRRKSMSSPAAPPNIASVMEGPVFGPQLPPPTTTQLSSKTVDEDLEMIDWSVDTVEARDDSSEVTLVDPETCAAKRQIDVNYENKSAFYNVESSKPDVVMVNGSDEPSSIPAPDKPPPIPPRNKPDLSISTNGHKNIIDGETADLLSFGAQQDVTEVMGNVINRLQCAIKPTGFEEDMEQIDIIRDTFFGTNTRYIQRSDGEPPRVEAWPYIIAYPGRHEDIRDLYESIDVLYDEQLVDVAGSKTPSYISISKLPPILQFQVQRSDFDDILKTSCKNHIHMPFPETMYMDRYVDTADQDSEIMRRRRETWKWKAQLRDLEARHDALKNTRGDINIPDALLATRNFITGLQEEEIDGIDISPELSMALEERISEVAAELEDISRQMDDLKTKLKNQFTDLREYEYKIHAVFIHRGEARGGHYWVYIYDSEHDIWREYNDEHVTEVKDRRRIFEKAGGADGTPYYMIYVRNHQLKEMVDVVCRDVPVPELTAEKPGEEMYVRMDVDVTTTYEDAEEEEDNNVRHVEYAKPRPIRPKLSDVPQSLEGWQKDLQDDATPPSHKEGVDANGLPW
ncbi:hypothetical protein LZ554_003829 [Drepanopeziza brunnea f. sp. 'monogermtubi']|nr:hypothetical protein LZ554_003829 [Drepanopeziza brunnea f. sp. 'monogermtubi']